MPKTAEEREALLEQVETAMLRGAFRIVDILAAVPEIKSRITAREYMDAVQNRWAGRQSDNEAERQRLIDEKREIIRQSHEMISDADRAMQEAESLPTAPERAAARTDARNAKDKAMKRILEAQSGIAKLLGLEVQKVEHSGSITEERNATIAILSASAGAHSIRSVLGSLGDSSEAGHRTISAQPTPVALPASQGQDSQLGSAAPVSSFEAPPMGRND